MKRVLITGLHSYIGDSVRDYLIKEKNYLVEFIDTIGLVPKPELFVGYDVVFNVAGIVHIKETKNNSHLYFDINRDLVYRIAEAAKQGGVSQFILLSSMSVYGKITGHISKNTIPQPNTSYGKSKLEADNLIFNLSDKSFKFACIRPPMVYGKNCKGNYKLLRRIALKSPVFPNINNNRSMIYIGNLCEFVKKCIDQGFDGVFFPQNADYVNTSRLVQLISSEHNKKIKLISFFNWIIKIIPIKTMQKVFGSLTYEPDDIVDKFSFEESISLTER